MAIDFNGVHSPKSVILHAVSFYVRNAVSHRDLAEIMAERDVAVDDATLNRWVAKYAPEIAINALRRKRKMVGSWCMEETHIKGRGRRTYMFRATDLGGKTP
jgi:putative transposase